MVRNIEAYISQAKSDYKQKELDRLGLTPEEDQHDQIVSFFCYLYDEAENSGVVSLHKKDSFFVKDFCDSIQPLLLFGFGKNCSLLDIKGKAGFPAIPIAIFRPDMKITIYEDDAERAAFLADCIEGCNLQNVTLCTDIKKLKKSSFDYVVQRGNETLQEFTRVAKDYVTPHGRMYTFETENFGEELSEITSNKDSEGVCVSEIIEYDLANKIMGLSLVSFDIYSE